MDIQEIDKISDEISKKYLEQLIINNPIIDKAIVFFNQYYNLIEHPFTREDVEKLAKIDFSIKLDFIYWKSINPITEQEINQFYRNTPFEFFKNLFKNMDVMHYERILKAIILSNLKKNQHKTVLDYGGGSGYLAILLYQLGYKVSFAEINKISIDWMKYITKELNMDIEIIDIQKQKIDKIYDVIIIKDVLEHLSKPQDILDELEKKSEQLIIIPDKLEKKEDYLPMHICYEIKDE